MKTFKILLLSGTIALFLPSLTTAQNWALAGNANANAASFLGTTNAFPLRLGTTAAQSMGFFTNNSERMTLNSAGLLGIGINAPLYRLHLTNSTNARSGYFTNTFVSNAATYGLYSETTNTGTGTETAGYFRSAGAIGTNTGVDAGASAGATNYGLRSTVNGSSVATSTNYGLYSSLTPSTSTTNYGIYSTLSNAVTAPNHYSGYFNNGKVYVGYRLGIGLTAPLAALHVSGVDNSGATSAVRITSGTQNLLLDGNEIDALVDGLFLNHNSSANVMAATGGGRVGIGSASPAAKLHVVANANEHALLARTSDDVTRLKVNPNGSVSIGTLSEAVPANGLIVGDQVKINTTVAADGYMLAVNGKVICEEVRVQLHPWPDYVFGPGYRLPDLAEVEKFIAENRHLPGIPSAATVEKEGLALGDMQRLTMEKVEELTLYMIQMKKENEELRAQMKALLGGQK